MHMNKVAYQQSRNVARFRLQTVDSKDKLLLRTDGKNKTLIKVARAKLNRMITYYHSIVILQSLPTAD